MWPGSPARCSRACQRPRAPRSRPRWPAPYGACAQTSAAGTPPTAGRPPCRQHALGPCESAAYGNNLRCPDGAVAGASEGPSAPGKPRIGSFSCLRSNDMGLDPSNDGVERERWRQTMHAQT
jgi:hypothetical protein